MILIGSIFEERLNGKSAFRYSGGRGQVAIFARQIFAIGSLIAISLMIPADASAQPAESTAAPIGFRNVVRQVQAKMVKIVGGGGARGWEPYQSGFCISEDGYILTAWSYVLEAEVVSVTLDDGQKYDGKLVGYDPQLEIAVLKIDTNGLSHFKIDSAVPAKRGARVLAFSNLYGVATGNEPVSVQSGVVSAVVKLASRRGAFKTAYSGEVYLVDAITNNPGAAGGVICDRKGRLLGMVGKEFVDDKLGTWLNFAVPIEALSNSVAEIRNGNLIVQDLTQSRKPSEPMTLNLLGIVLVPDVVDRTPPFIDRVVPGSAADRLGLRSDDLVISVDGQLCPSSKKLNEYFEYIDRDASMKLSVRRGREFLELTVDLNASIVIDD
jgi:serine protease Do